MRTKHTTSTAAGEATMLSQVVQFRGMPVQGGVAQDRSSSEAAEDELHDASSAHDGRTARSKKEASSRFW
ncbi:hypothetical protein [Streptomyces sp. bgisy031]|uniref:hypothetical protein n=1 Tax=Streptomyces sp. bgisy031 TaxID=3413772 RepID=UPI003D74F527